MRDVTEKKRPKRQRSEWFSDGSVVYERDEADAIFESLESDNQQLRKLLKEVEGVAPDKWIELQAERDALKARVEELEHKGGEVCAVLGNLGIHIYDLGLRSAGEMGKWQYRNERAEQAESDLAREKERSARLEKALELAAIDHEEHEPHNFIELYMNAARKNLEAR